MPRARRPGPLPLAPARTGRKVRSKHWFLDPETGTRVEGTGTSWADALIRCSMTGEELVISTEGEDMARVLNLRATIWRSGRRRALKVSSRLDGDDFIFTVVP